MWVFLRKAGWKNCKADSKSVAWCDVSSISEICAEHTRQQNISTVKFHNTTEGIGDGASVTLQCSSVSERNFCNGILRFGGYGIEHAAAKASANIQLAVLKNRREEIDSDLRKLRESYSKVEAYSSEFDELKQLILFCSEKEISYKVKLASIPDSSEEERKQALKSMYGRLLLGVDVMLDAANSSLSELKSITGDLDEIKFNKELARLEDERLQIEKNLDTVREVVHNWSVITSYNPMESRSLQMHGVCSFIDNVALHVHIK